MRCEGVNFFQEGTRVINNQGNPCEFIHRAALSTKGRSQ